MLEMSLMGFMARLASFPAELEHSTQRGLERAALLVEREAKKEIGTYQDQTGPFAAWAELADSTKEDRVKQGFPENEPLLRTGEMRDSISHAVGDKEAVVGSNDDKAVWQELGTDRIPPRSFLGGAAFRKEDEIHKVLGASVVTALVGHDMERLLPISGHED